MVYEIVVNRVGCPQVTVVASATDLEQVLQLLIKWQAECKRTGDTITVRGVVKEQADPKAVEAQIEKISANIAEFKRALGIKTYRKAAQSDCQIVPFRRR